MYRLTVAENSMPTDGKFVEIVGSYNPTALNQPLVVQKERVEYWLSKGAKPTNAVAKLLNKRGFNLPIVEYHKVPKESKKEEGVTKKDIAVTEGDSFSAKAQVAEGAAAEEPARESTEESKKTE